MKFSKPILPQNLRSFVKQTNNLYYFWSNLTYDEFVMTLNESVHFEEVGIYYVFPIGWTLLSY